MYLLLTRNDSLDGITFFLQEPVVVSILSLVGIIAFIAIIMQIFTIFKNATDDKAIEGAKRNIITIIIAFAIMISIPFIIKNIPSFFNDRVSSSITAYDEDGNEETTDFEVEKNNGGFKH